MIWTHAVFSSNFYERSIWRGYTDIDEDISVKSKYKPSYGIARTRFHSEQVNICFGEIQNSAVGYGIPSWWPCRFFTKILIHDNTKNEISENITQEYKFQWTDNYCNLYVTFFQKKISSFNNHSMKISILSFQRIVAEIARKYSIGWWKNITLISRYKIYTRFFNIIHLLIFYGKLHNFNANFDVNNKIWSNKANLIHNIETR